MRRKVTLSLAMIICLAVLSVSSVVFGITTAILNTTYQLIAVEHTVIDGRLTAPERGLTVSVKDASEVGTSIGTAVELTVTYSEARTTVSASHWKAHG